MATSAQAFAALMRLSPEAALAYLKKRGLITQSWSWADLWQEEHAQQFTVSRLANVDLLKELQTLITASVNGELSRTDFMRGAKAHLQARGWWGEKTVVDPTTGREVTTTFNPARLELIFNTNTRLAYAAGQWERIQLGKKTHPYLRYITKDDGKVRASHAQWHNLTLPVDDPFWSAHYPPNAWRCRCRVVSVSQLDYDKGKTPLGAAMLKTAPPVELKDWANPRTGEISKVPAGVHPAFAYNPGMARSDNLEKVVEEKIANLPKPLQKAWGAKQTDVLRLASGLPAQDYLTEFVSRAPATVELAGVTHTVNADLFTNTTTGALKIAKRGRGEYAQYYADAIARPDEVWESVETRRDTGEKQTVRRVLKAFDDGTLVVVVFTKRGDSFAGTSAFAAFDGKGLPDQGYYNRQRTGEKMV